MSALSIVNVMSLALCPQIMSKTPQHIQLFWDASHCTIISAVRREYVTRTSIRVVKKCKEFEYAANVCVRACACACECV